MMQLKLNEVAELFRKGKIMNAEILCRKILKKEPENIEAILWKAKLFEKGGNFQESFKILVSSINLDPNSNLISDYLFQKMATEEQYEWILDKYRLLSNIQKDSTEVTLCVGYANERLGQYDNSIICYRKVIDKEPKNERAIMALAHALRFAGLLDESIECYKTCISLRGKLVTNAYWSLSNLKSYIFSENDIEDMKNILRRIGDDHKRKVFLCFALGKAFEDLKDYEQSFEHYKIGNECQSKSISFESDRHQKFTKALVYEYSQVLFESDNYSRTSSTNNDKPIPIFVVGMPRSGSTLIEQILSSHSLVERTGELPYINRILWDLERNSNGVRYPEMVKNIQPIQVERYRKYYLNSVEKHRLKKKKYFIDKNPNNFENIGIIKMLFPEAKVIDTRREFQANAFSLFKQLFIRGQDYSYSFSNIQSYYSDYLFIMNFWSEKLPDQIFKVNYEQLVNNFEVCIPVLLEQCGLSFEEACTKFYENKQAVNTASSEQVRQPIYSDALEAWKNYRAFYRQPKLVEI